MEHLENPMVFQINRLEAHSDHKYYKNIEEMNEKKEIYKKYLNGFWKFNFSKNLSMRSKDFYKIDFDYSSWDNIKVPGHIQLQGYERPQYVNVMYPWDGHNHIYPPNVPQDYNPVGSYIKTFNVPNSWNKDKIFISFQGVESSFNLWINGEFVGYSEDSFTPSEFDISKYVVDGENKIAVEVIKWCSGSWLEDQDFWRFSGIFRDVYLYSVPEIHINDMFIKTTLDEKLENSELEIDIKLNIEEKYLNKSKIYFDLYDSKDNIKLKSNIQIINKREFVINELVTNVDLWSAEKPNLYNLVIYILDKNNNIIEIVPQKIGFRKFEIKNNIMLINNKRIIFKGVNRHEFNCYNGRVVTEEDMMWDINFLKQNNFNAVRTSHYPNNSRWYELCDEYGIYLIDETNLETHGSWQKNGICESSWSIPNGKSEWLDAILDRAKSMLERDKNHPSIIIWSCGNESFGGENLFKMSQYFREKDPSRIVHYEGLFWDRRFNDTSDMESRMYAKPSDIIEYLENNPKKPFINCEYTHSMGNSNGGMHKYIELESKYEMYQGGFIWDYIDQTILEKDRYGKEYMAYGGDFDDRPTDYNFCGNGIVYADRKPTEKVQEVKQLYSLFKLFPEKKGILIKNESLFSNCNEYIIRYVVKKENEILFEGSIIVDVEAQNEKFINIEFPNYTKNGEYIIEATLHLGDDTKWANRGHEICFGQYVYSVNGNHECSCKNTNESLEYINKQFSIENSDINLGVKGHNFHVIFSKAYGSMISLKYNNKEFIKSSPFPNFWRSPIDNDRGNNMPFRYAQWKIASLYRIVKDISIEENTNEVKITYKYQFPTNPVTYCDVTYVVNNLGKINVKMIYEGYENLSEMHLFGIMMKIKADYENIKWYGNGPFENYIDRKSGAKLGVFENKVLDNVTKYIYPQECGNKVDVRWFTISDDKGHGIKISSVTPFEYSAIPYTSHELENATHHYELPDVHTTVLNINKIQMGVGGDDSWGATTHEEYLIPSNKKMEFEFVIEML